MISAATSTNIPPVDANGAGTAPTAGGPPVVSQETTTEGVTGLLMNADCAEDTTDTVTCANASVAENKIKLALMSSIIIESLQNSLQLNPQMP